MSASGEAKSSSMKAAVTGGSVVLEMLSGGLAMENLKMEKQRTSLPYPVLARRVVAAGPSGWVAGFLPWAGLLGLTKGSVLGGARSALLKVLDNAGVEKGRADLISGFGAGAVQGVFMSPILLARTRVNQSLTERAAAAGGKRLTTSFVQETRISFNILNEAVRAEGIGMLATGMHVMVAKRALDWGTRFIIIRKYKEAFRGLNADNAPLSSMQQLSASFLGGATSCAITMPVDRMMPILQQSRPDSQTMAQFLRAKIASEGLGTLQRGFAMRALHTGYHTTFAVFVADSLYAKFVGK